MADLREALRRTQSKPLRAALENAQLVSRENRRPDGVTFRSWQGPWESVRRYRVADVVEHAGSSWRCLIEHTDSEPPSPAWELVAARGAAGPPGARGFIGPAGPQGPQGPAGGGALDIDDEGLAQGPATEMDFVGAGVTATVVGGVATVTIPGGGGSDAGFLSVARWGYP